MTSSALALLCSVRAPAGILLAVHDLAQAWRHSDVVIISGFHSPVEQEAFTILLRGPGRLVWVPARSRPTRLRPDVRAALDAGRLTIETLFGENIRRPTRETTALRNRYVCERADAVLIAYARPGSSTEALARELIAAGKPTYAVEHSANGSLFALGSRVYRLPAD